jgi:1-acyl-sn-glycerol-3-phosphate acyltransferase
MVSTQPEHSQPTFFGRVYSFAATVILWIYFLGGGILFLLLLYLPARLFSPNRQQSFQRINSSFFRGLLQLIRKLFPMHQWQVDETLGQIRSSVIVCNHVSYLDPLIMIALFDRQKTIVKSKFFSYPIFGWLIENSGYLPATTEGRFGGIMIAQMEQMETFLAGGGNLFIFPEGTRSRSGKLGTFNAGAFKIARLCKAPIRIIRINNCDRLFTPGRFMFNTAIQNTITITPAGSIDPDYTHKLPSAAALEAMVRSTLSADDLPPEHDLANAA